MEIIVYTKADGGVALGMICNKRGGLLCDPEAEGARVVAATPEFVSHRLADSADLPSGSVDGTYDKYFFGAFIDSGSKVGIDMERAQGIHRGRIRQGRDAELARLDIEQLKGNDVADAKQILRDLPATFDLSAAKTPAALRKLWPAELAPE